MERNMSAIIFYTDPQQSLHVVPSNKVYLPLGALLISFSLDSRQISAIR
jgi:hypothetical protein